jgi:hypothetical protein
MKHEHDRTVTVTFAGRDGEGRDVTLSVTVNATGGVIGGNSTLYAADFDQALADAGGQVRRAIVAQYGGVQYDHRRPADSRPNR